MRSILDIRLQGRGQRGGVGGYTILAIGLLYVILGGLVGGLMSDVVDQLRRVPLCQYNNHLSLSSGFALFSANHCIN
eukprot:scaffold68140_cov65-Attheya_sp.AAC.1